MRLDSGLDDLAVGRNCFRLCFAIDRAHRRLQRFLFALGEFFFAIGKPPWAVIAFFVIELQLLVIECQHRQTYLFIVVAIFARVKPVSCYNFVLAFAGAVVIATRDIPRWGTAPNRHGVRAMK